MTQNTNRRRSVAHLSMEIGIDERVCTYSGGLGVLAGDTIRSAADLRGRWASLTGRPRGKNKLKALRK